MRYKAHKFISGILLFVFLFSREAWAYDSACYTLRARPYGERWAVPALTLNDLAGLQDRLGPSIAFRRECLGLLRQRLVAIGALVETLPVAPHLMAYFTGMTAGQLEGIESAPTSTSPKAIDVSGYQDVRKDHLLLMMDIDNIERNIYAAGVGDNTDDERLIRTKITIYTGIVAEFLMFLNHNNILAAYDEQAVRTVGEIHRLALEVMYIRDELFHRALSVAESAPRGGFGIDNIDLRREFMDDPNIERDVVEDLDLNRTMGALIANFMESFGPGSGGVSLTFQQLFRKLRLMGELEYRVSMVRNAVTIQLPADHVFLERASLYILFYLINEAFKNAAGNFFTQPTAAIRGRPKINVALEMIDGKAQLTFSNNMLPREMTRDALTKIFVPAVTSRRAEQRTRLYRTDSLPAVFGGFGFGLSKAFCMAHDMLGGEVKAYVRCADGVTYCVEPRAGFASVTEADSSKVPYIGETGFTLVITVPGAYIRPTVVGLGEGRNGLSDRDI